MDLKWLLPMQTTTSWMLGFAETYGTASQLATQEGNTVYMFFYRKMYVGDLCNRMTTWGTKTQHLEDSKDVKDEKKNGEDEWEEDDEDEWGEDDEDEWGEDDEDEWEDCYFNL
jgi:hypothetical protein